MIDDIVCDIDLERQLLAHFGMRYEVAKMLLRAAPVGGSAVATLFINKEQKPFVYIESKTKLQLADVKKILSHMGVKPAEFFPPKGKPDYFEREATKKFLEVFPGRKHVGSEDLIFYKTLVDYTPALVQVAAVETGVVKVYDEDARGKWRPGAKFSYRQIKAK
ncbi:MAG: hypothetical protein LBG75_03370 [Candidatus Nomurabacteria bacterium]|jgi:hypothetical protein|nr:hypothetical protein [Candidatus Nomurabacteria bacterium]